MRARRTHGCNNAKKIERLLSRNMGQQVVRTVEVYEVLISSPSDVIAEREVVQEAIDQINQISASNNNFRLVPKRWEEDVSSQIGDHPQTIINEQIGDQCDIFIGILCNRFGQETENYESGTEEEFFRAYERHTRDISGPEFCSTSRTPGDLRNPLTLSS